MMASRISASDAAKAKSDKIEEFMFDSDSDLYHQVRIHPQKRVTVPLMEFSQKQKKC